MKVKKNLIFFYHEAMNIPHESEKEFNFFLSLGYEHTT